MMRPQSPQDLASAQSDLLNSEIHLLLNSSAKIYEATAHFARDASRCINERTQQTQRRL